MNKKCQVFTPDNYVKELLDGVGYTENLYGRKILENSCGDGNILAEIVRRYIADCRSNNLSRTRIKNGLRRDIVGYEIDPEQYRKCIDRLNLIAKEYGEINWSIINDDYLKSDDQQKFHYIVGNPPYITYSEMGEDNQKYLKKRFDSCKKGKFDYCYAFIEQSIKSLGVHGRMAYLIPSSIFKTVSGEKLRGLMLPHIESIKDYTQDDIFEGALIKSAIMVLERNLRSRQLHYSDATLNRDYYVPINRLGKKWFFSEGIRNNPHRFGDFYKVSHVVATLLNKAYVLSEKDLEDQGECFQKDLFLIEKTFLRPTTTPRSERFNKKEWIIFPYAYDADGLLVRYSDEAIREAFPEGIRYLEQYLNELNDRDADENAKWFEYGRSQALKDINNEKLLISSVITGNVYVYRLSPNCIPYGGMYIRCKDDNPEYTLEKALEILNSRDFKQYVADAGIHINSNSVRITSKDIEDYHF